ncbi:hypothetical protein [Simkania negevensis]|nr:hypothetical protein [Simkania negevensis]
MRTFKIFLMICMLLIASSCERGQNGEHPTLYNDSAQNTLHRELLLNIVRLRYSEPPFFVVHNTVVDHRSALSKFSHFVKSAVNGATKIPTGVETYPELSRFNFSQQFMAPIEVEVIEKLINHGWGVGQVFRILVKRLGSHINVESRSGPIPRFAPKFKDFLTLAGLLQEAHIQRQVEVKALLKEKETAEGESKSTAIYEKVLQLTLPPSTEETDRLADFLKITKKKRTPYQFTLVHNVESGIYTRSLLECLQYLSLGVQIPPKDLELQALIVTADEEGVPFDWTQVVGDLITIRWSKSYPENAFVAVSHHGYWFYLDEADLESKRTFSLLQYIFLHQVS